MGRSRIKRGGLHVLEPFLDPFWTLMGRPGPCLQRHLTAFGWGCICAADLILRLCSPEVWLMRWEGDDFRLGEQLFYAINPMRHRSELRDLFNSREDILIS